MADAVVSTGVVDDVAINEPSEKHGESEARSDDTVKESVSSAVLDNGIHEEFLEISDRDDAQ